MVPVDHTAGLEVVLLDLGRIDLVIPADRMDLVGLLVVRIGLVGVRIGLLVVVPAGHTDLLVVLVGHIGLLVVLVVHMDPFADQEVVPAGRTALRAGLHQHTLAARDLLRTAQADPSLAAA